MCGPGPQFAYLVLFVLGTVLANRCPLQHADPKACLEIEECSYCVQAVYPSNRCNEHDLLIRSGCLEINIIDELQDNCTVIPGIGVNCSVPITPGTKINVTVTWELAKHPLDLYYLMDFSGSMGDDKANVRLAESLISVLANLSADSALGFGVHVDKPINPLGGTRDYSFRNYLKISSNVDNLAQLVSEIPVLFGGDPPESQLDGLFQTAACTSEIGWREHARHLILLATDAAYHKAGDGAIGQPVGITTPFDGQCHLDNSGSYTHELTLDYPSEDQIVEVMAQNGLTAIFAVANNAASYRALAERIPSSTVGTLSSDSSNIIDIIINEYEKISSRFEMVQSNVSKEIQFKYYSDCNGDTEEETTVCEALSADGTITFTVEIDLVECPIDVEDWSQTVRLHPLGLPTYIDIAIALICNL